MPRGASIADPVDSMGAAKATEPERQKLAAFLSAVNAIMQGKAWYVADLIERGHSEGATPEEPSVAALRYALDEIAGDQGGAVNGRRLGRWLEQQVNRRVGGLWIERRPGRSNSARWIVCEPPKKA